MSEFQSFDNFSEDNSADNTTSSRHARAAEAADGLFHHDDAKHDGKKHGKRNGDAGKKPSHKSHGKSHKKNDRDALEIEPQAAEFSADEISHDADRADLTFEQLGVPQPIVDVLAKDVAGWRLRGSGDGYVSVDGTEVTFYYEKLPEPAKPETPHKASYQPKHAVVSEQPALPATGDAGAAGAAVAAAGGAAALAAGALLRRRKEEEE